MLSNFSQYAPQGLVPQIPGLQGIGAPQLNSASGQPGIYPNGWSGHELGQQAPNWGGQINPFGHSPLLQQAPFLPPGLNPNLQAQGGINAQISNTVQMVPVLGQLAQQLTIQCAIAQQFAQQLSVAVQHLAHQLAAQGLQGGYPGFNPQVQAWGGNRQPTIQ